MNKTLEDLTAAQEALVPEMAAAYKAGEREKAESIRNDYDKIDKQRWALIHNWEAKGGKSCEEIDSNSECGPWASDPDEDGVYYCICCGHTTPVENMPA